MRKYKKEKVPKVKKHIDISLTDWSVRGKIFIAFVFSAIFIIVLFLNSFTFVAIINNFARIFEINIHLNPFFYNKIANWWEFATSQNFISRTIINFLSIWLVYFMVIGTVFIIIAYILLFKELDFDRIANILWRPVRAIFRIMAMIYIFAQVIPVIVNTLTFLQTYDKVWTYLLNCWSNLYVIYAKSYLLLGAGLFVIVNYIFFTIFSFKNNVVVLINWFTEKRFRIINWRKMLLIIMWVNIWLLTVSVLLPVFIMGTPTLFWKTPLRFSILGNYLPWLSSFAYYESQWIYLAMICSLFIMVLLAHAHYASLVQNPGEMFILYVMVANMQFKMRDFREKDFHLKWWYMIALAFFLGDFFVVYGVVELFNQLSAIFTKGSNRLIDAGFKSTTYYFENLLYLQSFTILFFGFIGLACGAYLIWIAGELVFGWWKMSMYNYFKTSFLNFTIFGVLGYIFLFFVSFIFIHSIVSEYFYSNPAVLRKDNFLLSICLYISYVPVFNVFSIIYAPLLLQDGAIGTLILISIYQFAVLTTVGAILMDHFSIKEWFLNITRHTFWPPDLKGIDDEDYGLSKKMILYINSLEKEFRYYKTIQNKKNSEALAEVIKEVEEEFENFQELMRNDEKVRNYVMYNNIDLPFYNLDDKDVVQNNQSFESTKSMADEELDDINKYDIQETIKTLDLDNKNTEKSLEENKEELNLNNEQKNTNVIEEPLENIESTQIVGVEDKSSGEPVTKKIKIVFDYSKEKKQEATLKVIQGVDCYICDQKVEWSEYLFKQIAFGYNPSNPEVRIFHIKCFEQNEKYFEIFDITQR
ncbi:hypothetical protein SHELI_v1c10460 [Spiroplasma helicoides]|uniref:Transmembrane protein n=1 Tax=Spiroplasma helicoides TaxID=216938 RepID=A0A1B3SM39_9MOLU|nr:hypothetical protein [Spiroplasma helicoides]AOG60993.1 hypothetical protein SHELI_v1c10460 [Spiroplasma helicoides]